MNNTLPPELQLILCGVIGFILGLIVMWLLSRLTGSGKQSRQLKKELNQYQKNVDQHFIQTAEAVDELNRSYQNVIQQLSHGAHQLMSQKILQEQLTKRSDKSITLAYLATAQVTTPTTTQADAQTQTSPDDTAVTLQVADDTQEPEQSDHDTAVVVPPNGQPDRVADSIVKS